MRIALVWAASENGVIGRDGGLPWHLPDEMKHFVACTRGKPVLVARRTFETFRGPLPRRTNIVLTRSRNWHHPGVWVAHDLDAALALARQACAASGSGDGNGDPHAEECCVIGGAELYALALPLADRLYETVVHATIEGETVFPSFDRSRWRVIEETRHEADDRHAHAFTMRVLDRA